MRILSRCGHLLGSTLFVTIFSLISLHAQNDEVSLKTFLDNATEDIPSHPVPKPKKTQTPTVVHSKTVFHRVTEEVPDKPRPKFVSFNAFSTEKLNIQLGYFKEKRNVNKLITKLKSKHDWPVYVKTENKNGTDYFRVLIVDISNKKEANTMLATLKSDGMKGIIR